MDASSVPAVLALLRRNAFTRAGDLEARRAELTSADAEAIAQVHWKVEAMRVDSVEAFAPVDEQDKRAALDHLQKLAALIGVSSAPQARGADAALVYRRNADIRGPMSAFGYGYLADKLGSDHAGPLPLTGAQAYEALNLVDGQRDVGEIRDWLSAEFGPVALDQVSAYLALLAQIQVIRVANP
jgi:hypothetical protein